MFSYSKISNRIKTNEGFSNYIYRDKLGNKTIGYGHLVKPNDVFSTNKCYSKKILKKEFCCDLNKAVLDFKKNYYYKKLPNNAQEVIIEMIFQLGIKKVLNFKKFNYYIQKKKIYLAALEMRKSRWYHQTPKRVNKLTEILLSPDV